MEATDWRSLVEDAFQTGSNNRWSISPIWHSPASSQTLSDLEAALGRPLPQVLGDALAVSDGIGEQIRMLETEEEILVGDFLWPTKRMLAEAADLPSGFLFFADAGNGDSFGFSIFSGNSGYGPIIVHDHETGDIQPVAASFHEFVLWRGGGSLSV